MRLCEISSSRNDTGVNCFLRISTSVKKKNKFVKCGSHQDSHTRVWHQCGPTMTLFMSDSHSTPGSYTSYFTLPVSTSISQPEQLSCPNGEILFRNKSLPEITLETGFVGNFWYQSLTTWLFCVVPCLATWCLFCVCFLYIHFHTRKSQSDHCNISMLSVLLFFVLFNLFISDWHFFDWFE